MIGAAEVRLARQEELVAVNAVLGGTDWTARDTVGILVTRGEHLVGAAALGVFHRGKSALQLRYSLLDDDNAFPPLMEFAIDATHRAGAARLLVQHVPEETPVGDVLRRRGFQPLSSSLMFESDLAGLSILREAALHAAGRLPRIKLVPMQECPPQEFVALADEGIHALGAGVRALMAHDPDALAGYSASFGAVADGRLVGGVVATASTDPAFIEMLAVDRRFQRLGLTALLLSKCADALIDRGARKVIFSSGQRNTAVARLAQHLCCKITSRHTTWRYAAHA